MKRRLLPILFVIGAVHVFAQAPSAIDTISALADTTVSSLDSAVRELGSSAYSVLTLPVRSPDGEISVSDSYRALLSTRISQRLPGARVLTAEGEELADFEIDTTSLVVGDEVLLVSQIIWTDDGTVRAGAEIRGAVTAENQSAFFVPGAVRSGGSTGGGEPDDTPEQASMMAVPDTMVGRGLDVAGDVDWYEIDPSVIPISAEGQTMLAVQTRGNTDTYIEVYGPDGPYTLLGENDDYQDSNARVTVPVAEGSTYFALVRGFSDSSTGPYSLETSYYVAQLDDFEPDNSLLESTPVSLGEQIDGHSIVPGDDVDWFQLDLSGLDELLVVSISTRSELDTMIELYDSDGVLISSDDDSGVNGNADLLYPVSAPQVLYVTVRSFGGTEEGPYSLVVAVDDSEPDAYEPDDSPESATEFPMNEIPQEHSFLGGGDADWLVFDVGTAATVTVETYGDTDSYLRLYNEQLTLMAEDDDSGNNYNAQIQRPLTPGRYFVEATPLFGEGNAPYEIAIYTR